MILIVRKIIESSIDKFLYIVLHELCELLMPLEIAFIC